MVNFSAVDFLRMENISQFYEFNVLFSRFLQSYYSLEFNNIFDHIQYASCFIESILSFDDGQNLEIVIKLN